jgi:hypothetical protein
MTPIATDLLVHTAKAVKVDIVGMVHHHRHEGGHLLILDTKDTISSSTPPVKTNTALLASLTSTTRLAALEILIRFMHITSTVVPFLKYATLMTVIYLLLELDMLHLRKYPRLSLALYLHRLIEASGVACLMNMPKDELTHHPAFVQQLIFRII